MSNQFKPFELGRYQCVEELGSGGMAVVYRARLCTVAGFEKSYAIKKIHPHLFSRQNIVEMFIKEALVSSALDHGNIVRVFELNEDDGGYYLVMEYVDGPDLRRVLDEMSFRGEELPWELATYIIMELARALSHAHEKRDEDGLPLRLVHRDLSPSNVLLGWSGDVKLLDFGIAGVFADEGESASGVMAGKYSYMSPEQVRCRRLDGRSDIFGLGVLFYEMISDRPLFKADSIIQTIRKVEEAKVPPIEGLDPLLEEVLLKMLAEDPEARFQTAADVIAALKKILMKRGKAVFEKDLAGYLARLFAKTDSVEERNRSKRANSNEHDFIERSGSDVEEISSVDTDQQSESMDKSRYTSLEVGPSGFSAQKEGDGWIDGEGTVWTLRNRLFLILAVVSILVASGALYIVFSSGETELPQEPISWVSADGSAGNQVYDGGARDAQNQNKEEDKKVAHEGSGSEKLKEHGSSNASGVSGDGGVQADSIQDKEGIASEPVARVMKEKGAEKEGEKIPHILPGGIQIQKVTGARTKGDLDLHSEPKGASVIVGDRVVTQTPVRLKMKDGQVLQVVLNKEGRRLKNEELRMFGDSGRKIKVFLPNVRRKAVKAGPGHTAVSVVCKKSDIHRVYLNGWDTGYNCPVKIRVDPGNNNVAIRIDAEGRLDYKDFRLQTGHTATIEWDD